MRRFLRDMNPTVRGLLIVVAIALLVVVLQLQVTLASLFVIARIAFFLAIAFFLYLVWRERRGEIEMWPTRAKWTFYGAVLVIVAALAAFFTIGISGRNALAFFLILILCGFSLYRVWRDQHAYRY